MTARLDIGTCSLIAERTQFTYIHVHRRHHRHCFGDGDDEHLSFLVWVFRPLISPCSTSYIILVTRQTIFFIFLYFVVHTCSFPLHACFGYLLLFILVHYQILLITDRLPTSSRHGRAHRSRLGGDRFSFYASDR